MAKAKTKKTPEPLKDFFGEEVHVGDLVVVLYKVRGFNRLDDAYLWQTAYVGKDQWGHLFSGASKGGVPVRIKKPEMIKVNSMKTVKTPAKPGLRKENGL